MGGALRGLAYREGLEVELLVELAGAGLNSRVEELVGHGHHDAGVAGGVLGQGGDEFVGHEPRVAGLGERVPQAGGELLRGGGRQGEADADAAAERQQFLGAELLGQARVAAQHHGEQRPSIERGGAQQPQLVQDRGLHLLGFVDDQNRAQERGLDVGGPALAQRPSAGPAIVGRERDGEQSAGLAVEVGETALRAGEEAEGELESWGLQIGLVFQMVDDVLGIWGDASETGKSSTNDIARKKKSLPVVHGLQHAGAEERAHLLAIYAGDEVGPSVDVELADDPGPDVVGQKVSEPSDGDDGSAVIAAVELLQQRVDRVELGTRKGFVRTREVVQGRRGAQGHALVDEGRQLFGCAAVPLAVGDRVFARHPHQDLFTMRHNPDLIFRLPADMDEDVAVFANLADVALTALLDVPVRIGDCVVVFGQGVVGSLCAAYAKKTAGQLIVVDPAEERRNRALSHGVDRAVHPNEATAAVLEATNGRGADIAIEVSGAPEGSSS